MVRTAVAPLTVVTTSVGLSALLIVAAGLLLVVGVARRRAHAPHPATGPIEEVPRMPTDAPDTSGTTTSPGGRLTVVPRGRARTLLAVLDVPGALVRPGDDVAAVLTRFYAEAVRAHDAVHVVQLTAGAHADLGVELQAAGRIVGDPRSYTDLADPGEGAPVPGRSLHGLRRPRIDGAAVKALRGASSAVLVVETRSSRAGDVADAAAMLDGLGVVVRGVVVWHGRLPLTRP